MRAVLVYCRNHHCSHHIAVSADRWLDHARLSDIEPGFVALAANVALPLLQGRGEPSEPQTGMAYPAYFSPTLNGGSLPGGTVSSAIASIIATIT